MTTSSRRKAGRCMVNEYAAAERRRRSFRAIAVAISIGGGGEATMCRCTY